MSEKKEEVSFKTLQANRLSVWGEATISDVTVRAGIVHATGARIGELQIDERGVFIPSAKCCTVDASVLISTGELEVRDTVTASEYKLLDGTSVALPSKSIILFFGSVPPSGWVECDGNNGTPHIPTYVKGVIYIMRK